MQRRVPSLKSWLLVQVRKQAAAVWKGQGGPGRAERREGCRGKGNVDVCVGFWGTRQAPTS